jgi:hypothetical protein
VTEAEVPGAGPVGQVGFLQGGAFEAKLSGLAVEPLPERAAQKEMAELVTPRILRGGKGRKSPPFVGIENTLIPNARLGPREIEKGEAKAREKTVLAIAW